MSAAKPLLLLSRTQLRCFRQRDCNIMTAALAMGMGAHSWAGASATPAMALQLSESCSVKNLGTSSRGNATQLNSSHGRMNVMPGWVGARAASTIAEGAKLPEAELSYFGKEGNVHIVKVSELTRAKKVVLFAVPGAFTPTCSTQHVPGFVAKADELRKAGVDVLACVSVNDAFVMRAWGEQMNVGQSVLLLSDGLGKFTRAMGATVDLSDKPIGLGVRSRRYSMLVDDGVVKTLNIEEGGAFTTTSAEHILKSLQPPKAAPNVECGAGHNVM